MSISAIETKLIKAASKEVLALMRAARREVMPRPISLHAARDAFAREAGTLVETTGETVTQAVSKEPGAIRRALRKFVSRSEFKASFKHGVAHVKEAYKAARAAGSSRKKIIAKEAIGGATYIACFPLPIPNPGLFISPSLRAFMKGFFGKRPPVA